MYSEKVMDHFSQPRNVGTIENPDGYGKVGNASCGDVMEIFLKIENDIVTDVKFRTFGCAAAIATSSMATEMVIGKSVKEALEVTNKAVAKALVSTREACVTYPTSLLNCEMLLPDTIIFFQVAMYVFYFLL